jgi:MFS family permease
MMIGMLLAGALSGSLGFKSSYLVLAALSALSVIASLFIIEKTKNPKPPNGLKVIPRFDRAFLEKGLIYLYIGISLRMLGLVGVFSLIFVYMVEELGIAPSLMGIVASLNPASQILLLIFFGRLVDRVGRKRIFVLGFLLSAFVPLIFSFANGPGLMLLGYVVLGISYSALASGSTTFVSDVAPPSRSGELLGFLHTSRGLGGIFGPLIAGALASLWGYRVMFFVLAGAVFLGFLIASLKTEESLLK